jgi:hypothetical protein
VLGGVPNTRSRRGSLRFDSCAAPAEFGGPGDQWSPESLLAGAIASCFALTFRFVARAQKVCRHVLERAEHECLITNSLRCERELLFEIVSLEAA